MNSTNHESLKDKAVAFLHGASSGNVEEAYKTYVAEGFRHHNPYFKGDAESLKQGMKDAAEVNPNQMFEVKHAVQEGQTVMVHSHVKQPGDDLGIAVVHVFHFEDGRIVELWDIAQLVLGADEMVNEHGMF